jgi:hypothetical protein
MVKESNSSIIFFIMVVVRILFLRKVWGFLRLMSIQSGMTYAVKIPESASDHNFYRTLAPSPFQYSTRPISARTHPLTSPKSSEIRKCGLSMLR